MYLFEHGTKTLCQISQFWAGMDSFLWLIGEAIFHMLPVGICWSVTKKMGTTQMLGIVLGVTLVSGQLLNAYSVATTAAADIPKWDFGFVKVNMIGYQAQVLPAILAAFVLVYLEKFFRKITPQVVSMIALSNIAQGSAVVGMMILQRKNAQAQEVNIPSGISCYLGVTEPAIFGVNLKQGFPFICGMIGSAIAAIVCVATSTTANAIGVGGIPGILSIQPKYMGSFAICMLIAIVIPIVLTLIVGKKKLSEEEKNGKTIAETEEITEKSEAEEKEVTHLTAFLTGNVIPVKEVNDGVFSEGVMGDGIAIIPENDTLYAPADAQVAVLMLESKHACGLKLSNGMDILLHVGLDTVNMQGDGFEYLIEQGQFVKEGTPLIKFDREKIKKAGYRDVTICVISETGNAKNITFETGTTATANKTQVASWEN